MQKASSFQGKWRNVVFFLIPLLVVVADQLSKTWIRSYPEKQEIFGLGFFRIVHFPPHTGAAFGLFQGHSFALTIVALAGIAIILFYALFIYRHFPPLDNMQNRVAIGLILGGTVGNLIDRLCFDGVTDFICVGSWWPAFNIADSAITIGVIIFVYSLYASSRVRKQ